MATYRPLTDIPISLFTNSSTQASGYVLRAYLAGTTTPTPMYQDSAGTPAGTSVTLDARGEPATFKLIWLDESITYKFVFETDVGVVVWTEDNIPGGDSAIFDTIAAAAASALAVGKTLRVYGYLAAGDMPPSDYVVVAGGTGTNDGCFFHNMSNGNQLKLIHSNAVDVRQAGAKVDDSSQNFATYFNVITNYIRSQALYFSFEIFIPGKQFFATSPLNCSGFGGRVVTIRSTGTRSLNFGNIQIRHNGVGFDFTGSPLAILQDVGFQCGDSLASPSAGSIPTVGILFARIDPGSSNDCGYHVLRNVVGDGHCSLKMVYSYGSEVEEYYGCKFTNRAAGADCAALAIVQTNINSVASTFQTIATGVQSNTTVLFHGGQLWSTGGTDAKTVWLADATNIRFRDTFTQNSDGFSTFYISGGGDITIDGVREENSGAAAGPDYSVYQTGTTLNLSVKNYNSAAKQSSGYFLFCEAASVLYYPEISNIANAYANNGVLMRSVHFPNIFYAGSVDADTLCKRGTIKATPILIDTAETTELFDLATGQSCNFYKVLTASIANGATVDVTAPSNYTGQALYAYIAQSSSNSAHMSVGLFDTNNAGGTSNTLTLSNQRENNVAVTVPAANTLRITNNTGGAAAFYVRISALAG